MRRTWVQSKPANAAPFPGVGTPGQLSWPTWLGIPEKWLLLWSEVAMALSHLLTQSDDMPRCSVHLANLESQQEGH